MFKQLIKDGYQVEVPDVWLTEGNPWEVKRHDIRFEVGFSGKTTTEKGKTTWTPAEKVRLRWGAAWPRRGARRGSVFARCSR
jgi:starch phosphorylase